MTDTVAVKEESNAMKGSEADVKDSTTVERVIKSESHEQIQAEKDEWCTDNKNDVQVRHFSATLCLH